MEMKLFLAFMASLVIGFESFQVPQSLVNVNKNDPWIWVSLPEDDCIRSVLFSTKYGGDKCPVFY